MSVAKPHLFYIPHLCCISFSLPRGKYIPSVVGPIPSLKHPRIIFVFSSTETLEMNLDLIYVFIPFIFLLTSRRIFVRFFVSFLILSSGYLSIFLCIFFVSLLYFLFRSSSKPSVSFLVFLWLFYILEEFFEFSLSFFIYNLMDSFRFFIGYL